MVGKRVRDALYIHRSAIAQLTPDLRAKLQQALALAGETPWNVARLEKGAVGLLLYPDFDVDAFPALASSMRVELATGHLMVRSFNHTDNPLILHRKELLVMSDHPQARAWSELSRVLEERGLFREPHRIGRRIAWMKRLAEAGVRVEGNALSNLNTAQAILRHRTAMVRNDLSQPMALLIRHGLVKPGVKVFDYGCGQGDDLRALAAAGVEAFGWDPYFRPEEPRTSAAVVNLGFVLNVIEDPTERREALASAWALAKRVLSVATMIVGQVPVGSLRQHSDGYLTSRGTFQKYFQHTELRAFISQTLRANAVAVAPGIFFVFRAPEDEQEFLLNRRAGRRASTVAYRISREQRPVPVVRRELPERIPHAIAELATFICQRGRVPQADELEPGILNELNEQKVSLTRAVQTSLEVVVSRREFDAAIAERREDLLVHYALGFLNRSASASRPSTAMVRDIRAHFGSQKKLAIQATQYLHALAEEDRVREAMAAATAAGLGVLDHRGRLVANGGRADDFPGVLRCYFGCATFLSGEPSGPFLLRIDPSRKTVRMWPLLDVKDPFPRTEMSMRVDLRVQDVSIRPDLRRLVRKSDVFGFSPRSKQRRLEADYRADHKLPDAAIFHHLEDSTNPGVTGPRR